MNQAFFDALTNRLSELTQDLRFYHLPSEEMRAPQIIQTQLPRPTAGQAEGEEFPFVRWIIHEGEFARLRPAPFQVFVDGGIYCNSPSYADGDTAIFSLCTALGKIVEPQSPNPFKPYKLRSRIPFEMGVPGSAVLDSYEKGKQPHPWYYCRLQLEFVVANGHGG